MVTIDILIEKYNGIDNIPQEELKDIGLVRHRGEIIKESTLIEIQTGKRPNTTNFINSEVTTNALRWRANNMPYRAGDIPIDERVNEGSVDLTAFFPGGSTGTIDAYTAITSRSPYRVGVREGVNTRAQHQSTRRDVIYGPTLSLPDHVISFPIEVDGKKWAYETPTGGNGVGLRRVFTIRNQLIELDIDQSLTWLSAGLPGDARYQELRGRLEAESSIDNVNNQLIMQLMYDRIERGEAMLPNRSKKPRPDRALI